MEKRPAYPRLIESRIAEAMNDTPVVFVAGPRQAGKTTLARHIAQKGFNYLTLDDELTLLSARNDPVGLLRGHEHLIIDEIQRAPGLILAIKKSVDEDRRPGRFLLTGSANLLAIPVVTDSLAGRMETLSLLPLSQSEIEGNHANWIDAVFSGRILQPSKIVLGDDLIQRVLRGGYPEAISRPTAKRRNEWFRQYVDALVQKDIRDIAEITKLDELQRLLRALVYTAGQICNYTQLGGQVGLDAKTTAKYIGIFEQMYLLKRVEVWARNRLNRVIKSPKLQFFDSGLLSALQSLTHDEVAEDRSRFGKVLESFVFAELMKHSTSAEANYQLLHYRDLDQVEVDVVIENQRGGVVGVEIKASASVMDKDLKGLRKLANTSGTDFKMGLILYDGSETLPLGDKIWAAPISTLWGV
jgi:uncharacterized protein